jgi:hypothetical protein
MIDTFTGTDRNWLADRGFAVTDTTAEVSGTMTVNTVPHGHHHFRFSITLPSGDVLSGFAPKSKILGEEAQDQGGQR